MKNLNLLKLPNFFVIGAAKTGTTSLYHYLKQHPEIYLPDSKESFFFSGVKKNTFTGIGKEYGQEIVEKIEDYVELFQKVKTEKAIGEVCVAYIYFYKNAIANFGRYLNKPPKIIILLRNPVERAFSNYKHHARDRMENLSFEEAIEPKILRKRNDEKWWWGFQYLDVGFYYNQVSAYLHAFDRGNVRIYLYEDFKKNAITVIKNIFEFLEVNNDFIPEVDTKHNVSNIYKYKSLNQFFTSYDQYVKKLLRPLLLKVLGKERTTALVTYFNQKNILKVDPNTKKEILKIYKDDILKLAALIDHDLSDWLE